MPGRKKSDWSLAYHGSPKVVSVPEPLHRVTPTSSGVSFRKLPTCSVEEVKKICSHYVQKCTGKYEDNKAAARYVHQMATEVIAQLAGVAEDIKYQQEMARIACDRQYEWELNFPESLKAVGTPQDIVTLLNSQAAENESLRKRLETIEEEKKLEAEHFLRSMNVQIQASRSGAIGERHQMSLKFNSIQQKLQHDVVVSKNQANIEMQQLEEYYLNQIQNIHEVKEKELQDLRHLHQQSVSKYESDIKRLNNQIDENDLTYNEQRNILLQRLHEEEELKSETESEFENEKERINGEGGFDLDKEFISCLSDCDDLLTMDSVVNELKNTSSPSCHHRNHIKKCGTEKHEVFKHIDEKYHKIYKKLKKIFRKKIKRVEFDLEESRTQLRSKCEEIEMLLKELSYASSEITNLHRRVASLKEINSSIRLELASSVKKLNDTSTPTLRNIQQVSIEQHIPHFLMCPDKRGIVTSSTLR